MAQASWTSFVLVAVLAGCGGFAGLATDVAHAERSGAQIVRRDARVAFALCRQNATYAYLETTLGIGPDGPVERPELFAAWYEHDVAAYGRDQKALSWRLHCQELDRTGDIFHRAVLVLGEFAAAIEAMAGGEAFDGAGLESLGQGIGDVADTLPSSSSLGSVARGIGSAGAGLAGTVVALVRTETLRRVVRDSSGHVGTVVKAMADYLGALELERQRLGAKRGEVLRLIDARRDEAGRFTAAAEGALAFDLAHDGEGRLERLRAQLASDGELVAALGRAHAELAAAAGARTCHPARAAAERLRKVVDDLEATRPEVP